MSRALVTIAFGATAACTPSVPAQPSFQLDVLPLLAANCQRCHGTPPLYDAPAELRLDMFGDTKISADATVFGAASLAETIATRTAADEQQMPPRFPLDDWQIETFERWAINPVRGEPRPGNRAPHATVEHTERDTDRITLRVQVEDTDGDPVGGELRIWSATEDLHFGNVRSGVLEVTRKTAGITAGDYSLTAHLDDGASVHVIPLGMLTIGAP
jgi:hypothetical protein